jgi:hypothetical protein
MLKRMKVVHINCVVVDYQHINYICTMQLMLIGLV